MIHHVLDLGKILLIQMKWTRYLKLNRFPGYDCNVSKLSTVAIMNLLFITLASHLSMIKCLPKAAWTPNCLQGNGCVFRI